MADDFTFGVALESSTLLHSLIAALRRKGIISAEECAELYDDALLKLETIAGAGPISAGAKAARERLELFVKAARTGLPSDDPK